MKSILFILSIFVSLTSITFASDHIEQAAGKGKVIVVYSGQCPSDVKEEAIIKIKELIDRNELGKVHRFQWTITNWFRTNYYYQTSNWRAKWESEGGGVLINQSIHQLDLCQWLFGMPDSIYTDLGLGRFHTIEVEDEVTSIFKYSNGLKGVFITTTGEAPGVNRLEIASDKGLITIQDNMLTNSEVYTALLTLSIFIILMSLGVWHVFRKRGRIYI